MTRPTRWKIWYVVTFLLVGASSCWIIFPSSSKTLTAALVALVLLIPGRICGHFYRDLHTGVRFIGAKRYPEAVANFKRFLSTVRSNSWLKKLIWFAWAIYTRDIEAMALNNIGAALLEEGKLDCAARNLAQALAVDPKYPMPFYYLAVIAELRGDRATAEESVAEAIKFGYRRTSIDKVVHKAGLILSAVEGRKPGSANAA